MVSNIRRSQSLPKSGRPNEIERGKSCHVRSTSLPCTSHPLVLKIKDQIETVKIMAPETSSLTSARIFAGLCRLSNLYRSVDDLLQLPQTLDSLRKHTKWVDKLLEDFLRLLDAYGVFRAEMVTLREAQSAMQIAIRHRVHSVDFYIKSRKKMDREMAKIVAEILKIEQISLSVIPVHESDTDVLEVLQAVCAVTVSISVLLFSGVSTSSNSSSGMKLFMGWKKGKREEEGIKEFRNVSTKHLHRLEKWDDELVKTMRESLDRLEDCIHDLENASELIFRSLINTRVSLLNIVTM